MIVDIESTKLITLAFGCSTTASVVLPRNNQARRANPSRSQITTEGNVNELRSNKS